MIYLSAITDKPQEIIDNANRLSQRVEVAVKVLWDVLKTPLFVEIANLGAIIAFLFAAFWFFRLVRHWLDPEMNQAPESVKMLLIAVLLLVLLGTPTNRGKLLGNVIVSADKLGNALTEMVLQKLQTEPNNPLNELQVQRAVRTRMQEDFQRCSELPSGEERDKCALEGQQRVSSSVRPYLRGEGSWAQQLGKEANYLFYKISDDYVAYSDKVITGTVEQEIKLFIGDSIRNLIASVLFLIAAAFMILLRVAKPIVALVMPLYVGLTFVPSSKPPIIFGMGLFMDLFLIELIFKIFLVLIARVMLLLPGEDPLLLPIFW
ncbi:MAG: hypothetical protein HC768_17495 [Acaryochloris sp. CRU_2_0]|nr:hypothetical protein [Acaryochloris sp. CRU_2_0]